MRAAALFVMSLFLCSCAPINSSQSSNDIQRDADLMCVHYIDVGQGDSTFIELPNKQTMLIDSGNPKDAGMISEYIRNLGYSKLNYVVATHPHSDHIGGMADIISEFETDTVYLPDVSHTSTVFENMVDAIYEKNINTERAKSGVTVLDENNLKIEMLAPVNDTYSDLNEYSAVVKIIYKETSFLFMGDSGHLSEREIINSGADVSANVLKCGHHGSSTSSDSAFAHKVSPDYAIISCGANNSYGHPHDETIELFQSMNAKIYRTDTEGTIVAISDGKNISVEKAASVEKENAPPEKETNTSNTNTYEEKIPAAENSGNAHDTTVYITKSGSKYHSSGCTFLRNSKISISRSEAEKYGYEPCSVCKP